MNLDDSERVVGYPELIVGPGQGGEKAVGES
jgi:hypothetical protein